MGGKTWYVAKRSEKGGVLYLFSADNYEDVKETIDVLFIGAVVKPVSWQELLFLVGGLIPDGKEPEEIAKGPMLIPGTGVTDICLWPL